MSRQNEFDYLVGGLRVSVRTTTTTPGPRAHILGFLAGAQQRGVRGRLVLANELPGLRKFATIREGSGGKSGRLRVFVADLVRLAAALYSGVFLFASTSCRETPYFIYERVAVMHHLSVFHAKRRQCVRVVESNGLMTKETAADRGALVLTWISRAIEKHVYESADVVVAVSAALRDAIVAEFGTNPNKIIVVPNAVPDLAKNIQREDSPEIVVGYVGSAVAWQQLDLLLKAFASCAQSIGGTKVRLEIIGAGPEVNRLKNLIDALSLTGSVTLYGALKQAAAFDRMRRWDIGYCGHKASSSANMYHSPLKLYEYAGLGMSVLSTASDDAESLALDGLLVYWFGDEDSLTEALATAITDRSSMSFDDVEQIRARVVGRHSWSARFSLVEQRVAEFRGLA